MGGQVLLLWGKGAGAIGGAVWRAVAIAGALAIARKKARAMAGNGGQWRAGNKKPRTGRG